MQPLVLQTGCCGSLLQPPALLQSSSESQHTWRLLLEALWALERQLRSWAMGLAAPEALTGGDTPRNVCLGVLLSRHCTDR